ncbi:MAG: cytidylate kinase-like family protein [Candidatus Beckwithbacteria bacterium]|nr:cytidylate kinase-like family protein [Patescibacteria group bacterium]
MGLFASLIFNHVKRRELVIRDRSFDQAKKGLKFKPFITVSRESGSGGKLIAKKVAKKLNFQYYNKKLIEMTSRKAKKRKALIATLDEKERGFMDDLVHSLLNPDYVSEQTFIKSLFEVVLSIARKGHCVIIGRGGNFITSQYGGLNVRVVAPFLVRAGFTAQYEKYSLYEARERVKKFDKERKEYIKQYFGKDPSNANYYDLVINTTYLSIDQAVDIVIMAFKRKFPEWRPGIHRVNKRRLRTRTS